ncbi:hypothetical protein M408DRAFT_127179 [Serendipita vermifera MAFF 305830]|uniref:Mid2 domain-containing protein n=1 Tax=Serendipita vermifera MAFF 305830 TaxID=933852 RepID=A0A0C3BC72_SERVB|nr:hypothetical protein M408DRAFT_127179 [Serendipita vermifera MAFF 305830]
MIPYEQRRLLLLIQLLTVWIFTTVSSAQSVNDTSPFVVTAPESFSLCQAFELSWPTNDTTTLYFVYLARGSGPIGNEDSLTPETEIVYTAVVPALLSVDKNIAGVGDVVRFRVQPDDGRGISAVACSCSYFCVLLDGNLCLVTGSVVSSNVCWGEDLGGTDSISSFDDGGTITTKNTEAADLFTQTAAILGITVTDRSPNPTKPATSGPQAASQGPSQLPATATPTNADSNQGNNAPLGNSAGSSNGNDSSDPATSSGAQQGSGGGIEGQNSSSGRARASQPSQTAIPDDSSGDIDTATKQNSLSMQAVGIIAGTITTAVFLCIVFMLWRWRRRKQPVAVKPRKNPPVESVRELLTPSSEESGFAQSPVMAEAPPVLQNPTQTLAVPPRPDGSRVPSYDEATGLYSPLNTPDPFRNVFGVGQYPGIILSRPRNSLPI